MSYVDAHIHLADPAYQGKHVEVLDDAARNGIAHLVSNAVDYDTSLQTIQLAKQHKGRVLAAVGLHPSTVVYAGNSDQAKLEQLIVEQGEYVSAIGEIGLDGKYTQDEEKLRLQSETFQFFLGIAEKRQSPVVVHSRYAVRETLQVLSRFNLSRVLLHWYDGPIEHLKHIQNQGYLISIGPSIVYSKRIAEIARTADLDMVITETDGPVPHHGPFEGIMTKPSFVVEVVKKLAELKSLDVEIVRQTIWNNFERFIPT